MVQKKLPDFDPFVKIGAEFALLGAVDGENKNAMTVSWGECGVLWNKNVFTVFVRPQRYTHEILKKSEFITLSFFGNDYKDEIMYFGRVSGRDEDKFEKTSLFANNENGALVFEKAHLTLVGKIIYKTRIDPENFVDEKIAENYPSKDYHTVYTCEIIKVIEK